MLVNSLNHFSAELPVTVTKRKRKVNLKGLLKTLRRKWRRGTYRDFDKLLAQIAECDLETASKIRESWEDLDILGYDREMFLVWCKPRGI